MPRVIEVFTTRPDTLFGATYMVLAPEHPLVDGIVAESWPDGHGSALDRRCGHARRGGRRVPAGGLEASPIWIGRRTRSKTGVFTGRVRREPRQRNPSAGVHRGLRADGLRHRRDHGACRGRTPATGTSPRRSACRSCGPCSRRRITPTTRRSRATGPAINSANDEISLDGLGVAEAKIAIIDWLADKGCGPRAHPVQAAGLAVLPAAVLGRAVPDRLRRRRASRSRCRTTSCR